MASIAIKDTAHRRFLRRLFKLSALLACLLILLVFIDYSFNQAKIGKDYRFEIPQLSENRPVLLQQDSMIIVLAHYNDVFLSSLYAPTGEDDNIQPRIDANGYFVALAYGSDMGCPVRLQGELLKESCSPAQYDLLGRSLDPGSYGDLEIPRFRWNQSFTALTIYQE